MQPILALRLVLPTLSIMLGLTAVSLLWAATRTSLELSDFFLLRQDAPVLVVEAIMLVALRWSTPVAASVVGPTRWAGAPFAICTALICTGAIGWPLVFDRRGLSLDEFWATFDATIFAHGRLAAPIAESSRRFAAALQPVWRLPSEGDAVWASTYLPMNAAVRGALSRLALDGWAGGLWTGLGAAATWAAARRLWPERRDAAIVALLLVATSSQVLISAMTPYAMPAHFALNMVWLCLYLRRDWWALPAALAVGAVACGLHQLLFHLLFAAPFVLELWSARRRRAAVLLAAGYAVIALFWMSYWSWALPLSGGGAPASHGVGQGWFLQRALQLLESFKPAGLPIMAENLVRFIAWQNPLLMPLVLAGALSAMTSGVLRPLLLGAVLTLTAMFVLLPYQGHGWGYRYLHGHIGALALVAAGGWIALTTGAAKPWPHAATALMFLSSASVFVLFPIHALQAWSFAHPYAEAQHDIDRRHADVVLVDDSGVLFGQDLVRNDPFLQRRPMVMLLGALSPEQVSELCRARSLALFSAEDARLAKVRTFAETPSADVRAARMRLATDPACRLQALDGRHRMLVSSRFGKAAAMGKPR